MSPTAASEGAPDVAHPRIRTFHPRRSRISPTAASALTRLMPVWGVEPARVPRHPADLFDPRLPVILEIGPGMGEATVAMATADPGTGILAVDVHTPGLGALLARVEHNGLTNVRVCEGDAWDVLDRLACGSLAGIRAFFPDPWPKARHHKRRLVQPAFVRRAVEVITPGGSLHLATDIREYAEHMVEVAGAEPGLVNPTGGLRERPRWRPETAYERRGKLAGRPSVDLILERV